VDSIELALIQATLVLRKNFKECLLLLGASGLLGINKYGIPRVMEGTKASTTFPVSNVGSVKIKQRTGLPGTSLSRTKLGGGTGQND
jgi:hypothetical protein